MPTEKRKFGDVGEKIACYFLKNKGYSISDKHNPFYNFDGIDGMVRKNKNRTDIVIPVKISSTGGD